MKEKVYSVENRSFEKLIPNLLRNLDVNYRSIITDYWCTILEFQNMVTSLYGKSFC